ncbi:cytochrome P450 [Novosphingobium colocasiae]
MKAGQRVFLIVAAGNHDPLVFDDPDALILDRMSERQHLGFGYGLHSCMGLQLARLETAIAVPGILGRWGGRSSWPGRSSGTRNCWRAGSRRCHCASRHERTRAPHRARYRRWMKRPAGSGPPGPEAGC